MQFLSLTPVLILLLYFLVSIDLVLVVARNCSGEEQLFAKLNSFCAV